MVNKNATCKIICVAKLSVLHSKKLNSTNFLDMPLPELQYLAILATQSKNGRIILVEVTSNHISNLKNTGSEQPLKL